MFSTLPGSTWRRRMSNTQKLGLKSMLLLLISITSLSSFFFGIWLVPPTLHVTQKHAYLENKKVEMHFQTCPIIVYCTHRYIVFRRISKQHIFRFQNIYNVGGNITHLTENIPCLPFWNWIALLIIGKPILILTMTVVSWIANTKAQI